MVNSPARPALKSNRKSVPATGVCANVLFWEGMQESEFIGTKSGQTLCDLTDFCRNKTN